MPDGADSRSEGLGANAKRAAVQRVARGESPDTVARSISVPTQMLMEWVRKYESAKQDAPDSPDEEHLAVLRDRPAGHSDLGPSMAEIDYPELLKGVDPKYYESLTGEQQHELIIRQAIAQEKVGYEKYAPKYFLPEDEDPFPEGRRAEQADMFVALEINRPLLILSGLLLGLVISLAALKLGIDFGSVSWWVLASGAAAAVVLLFIGSR